MPLIQTPAIVLRSRSLGEADKLVTLFTSQQGKLTGAAKGARRVRSPFGASLEPFTHCQVILFQKTRESLFRIQQAGILESFQDLREDLCRIAWASRMISLASAMTPEGEANPSLFSLLLETLDFLRTGDGELAVRLFEIRLLKYTGYQLRLDSPKCLRCSSALNPSGAFLSPAAGGIICEACSHREGALNLPVTRGAAAFLRQAATMPSGLTHRLRAAPALKEELKSLLEIYLDYLLGRTQRF